MRQGTNNAIQSSQAFKPSELATRQAGGVSGSAASRRFGAVLWVWGVALLVGLGAGQVQAVADSSVEAASATVTVADDAVPRIGIAAVDRWSANNGPHHRLLLRYNGNF